MKTLIRTSRFTLSITPRWSFVTISEEHITTIDMGCLCIELIKGQTNDSNAI